MSLVKKYQKNLASLQSYLGLEVTPGAISKTFTGLSMDSRKIETGDLFFALKGETFDGNQYLAEVKAAGAAVVLSDDPKSKEIYLPNLRRELGVIAQWFYGYPGRAMQMVGITGTNGKTTTADLIFQLWSSDQRVSARIGTLGVQIGNEKISQNFTTPEAIALGSNLALARDSGVRSLVMEVSSHALSQYRVKDIFYDFAVFTNLTQDHLDFHKNMESYYQAKAKLFSYEYARTALINIDDPYGRRLASETDLEVQTLSRSNKKADWYYEKITSDAKGFDIKIRGLGGILIECYLPLLGEHNLDNFLAAVAVAINTGVDPLVVSHNSRNITNVPGRLEQINIGQPFTALVDYAHTPDAIERTLTTLRKNTAGKIISVLGAGGDRDRSKRSLMAKAAISNSDLAIFTSDNPRSESPAAILDEMLAGIKLTSNILRIEDRAQAIRKAVSLAVSGDTLILLGKGHELGQIINGVVYPFDDRIELENAIKELS
jgi:UDP-N-acetylmuramoyl-L-alanyl-D-glutamate--2,6-diaminopimelate ligase